MNATLRHLAMLAGYGRGRGYFELRWRTSHGMRSEQFPISELDAAALRARALAGEHDVYVGAAPRARKPRRAGADDADGGLEWAGTRDAIAESWVVWADCDRSDSHDRLRSFAPCPPLAIASGGGGTHAYWPLARPVGPDLLEQVNRRLAHALDADCQSVDAARILRPAGTLNHKHAPARPVAVRWFDEGAGIELAQLVAALPPLPAERGGCAGTVEPREPRGDPLLAIPPTVYVPVLVGAPLDRDRKLACPFHEDRTPSLHAFGRGRGWRCFGCGACGSIFDLAARLWGLQTRRRDFRELRRRLAATFSVPDAATPPRRAHRHSSNKRH